MTKNESDLDRAIRAHLIQGQFTAQVGQLLAEQLHRQHGQVIGPVGTATLHLVVEHQRSPQA